jgi:hypothetical protein
MGLAWRLHDSHWFGGITFLKGEMDWWYLTSLVVRLLILKAGMQSGVTMTGGCTEQPFWNAGISDWDLSGLLKVA